MKPSKGLGGPYSFLAFHKKLLKRPPSFSRYYSRKASGFPHPFLRTHLLPRSSSPWRVPNNARNPPIHTSLVRLASTVSNPPPIVNSEPFTVPQDDFSISSDSINTSDFNLVTEHIGYLKELGLDFGWGPTAFVETLLEHVHIWTDTPWWASIVFTAVLVRVVMLKAYVGASDTAARMAVITPHIKPIQAKIAVAKQARDQQAMMAASAEMQGIYRSAKVQLWRLAVPMLQVPLGYGTFRLMRGMAALPVPGLDEQGLLWLQDLTLSDPYFILPIVTAGAFHYTFKKGGELGSATAMKPFQRNLFVYGFPAMTGFFMLFWPGCMQLTFFTTAMMSLSQSWALRQPGVRKYLGIQPLPSPASASPPKGPYTGTMNTYQRPAKPAPLPEKKGVIEGAISDLKGAAGQAVKSARTAMSIDPQEKKKSQGRTREELRRAQAYEEKRRRELAQEKFEKTQRKRITKI